MLHVICSLFMACCMFVLAWAGLMIAMSMWRKSNTICSECENHIFHTKCEKELDK